MTQHRNRKRRGNFLWRTGELVSHSSWESYSILYQLAKLLEQLPKYKWWACSRVPQSVQGSQKWKTDLCIAGINIKTCKEMKHYKRICCVGPKKKKLDWMGREFHSTVEMTVDIKGKRSKWNLKKKRKARRWRTNECSNSFVLCLSLPGCTHLLPAPPASVHSHKSRSGILAGESRINTAGEMSVRKADKPDLERGRVEAVMSPHFNTPAISLHDI